MTTGFRVKKGRLIFQRPFFVSILPFQVRLLTASIGRCR